MGCLGTLAILITGLWLLYYWRERIDRRRIGEVYRRYLNGETLVCLDLETTGLRAGWDKITEVGAIKFCKDGVLQEFSMLVNPGKPIPRVVQQMTGITAATVRNAPLFEWMKGDLQVFLGDSPLVGYNIDFDLAFIRKQGLRLPNSTYDVLAIARRCVPARRSSGRKQRYKLGSIARYLAIRVGHSHRALDDARTTMEVFKRLQMTEYVTKKALKAT